MVEDKAALHMCSLVVPTILSPPAIPQYHVAPTIIQRPFQPRHNTHGFNKTVDSSKKQRSFYVGSFLPPGSSYRILTPRASGMTVSKLNDR